MTHRNDRATAEAVYDRFGPELITQVDQAIRASLARHPSDATCECLAFEALGVLVRNRPEIAETPWGEIERLLAEANPQPGDAMGPSLLALQQANLLIARTYLRMVRILHEQALHPMRYVHVVEPGDPL